jgi:hypothetical protein
LEDPASTVAHVLDDDRRLDVPKPVNAATVTAADVDAAIAARDARLENAWRAA